MPSHCSRPCGVHFHYFKVAGGMVMGGGVLGPLFSQPNLSWVDTYSLAHAGTAAALARAEANKWPRVTVKH